MRLQLARLARPLLAGPPPRRAVLAPTCAAEPFDGVRAPPPRHVVRRRCPPLLRSVTPPRRPCAPGPRLPHEAHAPLRVPCSHRKPTETKADRDTRSNLPVSGHLALALCPSPFPFPELAVPAPLLLTAQMGRSVSAEIVYVRHAVFAYRSRSARRRCASGRRRSLGGALSRLPPPPLSRPPRNRSASEACGVGAGACGCTTGCGRPVGAGAVAAGSNGCDEPAGAARIRAYSAATPRICCLIVLSR
eukprot:COSAG04_NODE_5838_length_1478_cov_1.546773_1_plen_246_part_10